MEIHKQLQRVLIHGGLYTVASLGADLWHNYRSTHLGRHSRRHYYTHPEAMSSPGWWGIDCALSWPSWKRILGKDKIDATLVDGWSWVSPSGKFVSCLSRSKSAPPWPCLITLSLPCYFSSTTHWLDYLHFHQTLQRKTSTTPLHKHTTKWNLTDSWTPPLGELRFLEPGTSLAPFHMKSLLIHCLTLSICQLFP